MTPASVSSGTDREPLRRYPQYDPLLIDRALLDGRHRVVVQRVAEHLLAHAGHGRCRAVGLDAAGADDVVSASSRANDATGRVMVPQPLVHTAPPEESRRARAEGKSVLPLPPRLDDSATDRTIRGRGGDVGLRVFVPETVSGVVLHIH